METSASKQQATEAATASKPPTDEGGVKLDTVVNDGNDFVVVKSTVPAAVVATASSHGTATYNAFGMLAESSTEEKHSILNDKDDDLSISSTSNLILKPALKAASKGTPEKHSLSLDEAQDNVNMFDGEIGVQLYKTLTDIVNCRDQNLLSVDALATWIDSKLTNTVFQAVASVVKDDTFKRSIISIDVNLNLYMKNKFHDMMEKLKNVAKDSQLNVMMAVNWTSSDSIVENSHKLHNTKKEVAALKEDMQKEVASSKAKLTEIFLTIGIIEIKLT